MSVGFMLAFPLVGSLVQEWGWRGAWLAVGCSLLCLLAPVSAVLVRCGPESRGLLPDGDAVATAVHTAVTAVEWTGSYTMMFRVLAGIIALVGGLALFTSDRIREPG